MLSRASLRGSGEHFPGVPCWPPETPSFPVFVGGRGLCGVCCHALSYAGVRLARTRLDFARWALYWWSPYGPAGLLDPEAGPVGTVAKVRHPRSDPGRVG